MNYPMVVNGVFSQIKGVRFNVRFWDGKQYEYGLGDDPMFTIVFNSELAVKRLISQGSIGFGESYMDGSLVIEGDLEAYLGLRHAFKTIKPSLHLIIASYFAKRDTLKNRNEQISYHYDIGNDFFGLLLDKDTMSYSAGLYENGDESLGAAQKKKIKLVCDWLNLPSGSKVLDLGSGWGGFSIYAAKKHKWKVSSYTLSNKQLDYCNQLINDNKLQQLVSVRYQDMVENIPEEKFDAIVMLESIEHVGKDNLPSFIENLYQRLKPGGIVYIQMTGRYISKPVDKWTLKYVFPGGYLPAKQETIDAAKLSGFKVEKFIDDTPDYIKTMQEWIKNLEKNQITIEKKFGISFYRLWRLWMHGAKVSFETNSMNLFRIKLRRPK